MDITDIGKQRFQLLLFTFWTAEGTEYAISLLEKLVARQVSETVLKFKAIIALYQNSIPVSWTNQAIKNLMAVVIS